MIDSGIYSHWYQRIRAIAELVDNALVELRSPTCGGKATNRLGELLTATAPSAKLARQALAVLLRDANSDLNLELIGRDLRQATTNSEIANRLEHLAEILEHERTSTIEQMRK